MPNVITVWHLGGLFPNLTVPPSPQYALIEPFCKICVRPHCDEVSIVSDGVVGCLQCNPQAEATKYAPSIKAPIARPQSVGPNLPARLIAQHTLYLLGGYDGAHAAFVVSLPPKDPQHHGEEGAWIEVTATCTLVKSLGFGDHGEKFLVKFSSGLVWYTGDSTKFQPAAGETHTFKAKVKRHSWFNGQAETVVTHCKLPKENSDA